VDNFKPGIAPQTTNSASKFGVDLDPNSAADSLAAEDSKRCRKETARTDGRIGETNALVGLAEDGFDVMGDLDGKGIGRCELAKAISLLC